VKREFKIGDRVAVKRNGETIARGHILALPDAKNGIYTVLREDGIRDYYYSESLRHLKPKTPRREFWIYKDVINDGQGVTDKRPANTDGWICVREVRNK